ncbi:hypothetical protein [Tissierella sp.]|uniref:hypothetical protein n=1 Tax=Tissierella sp. TaxID=41274 RepID=UPI003064A2DB
MKVRTLIRFSDLKEKVIREVGDEFEATAKRVEEINSTRGGTLVEVIEEKPKKKKSSNKAGD